MQLLFVFLLKVLSPVHGSVCSFPLLYFFFFNLEVDKSQIISMLLPIPKSSFSKEIIFKAAKSADMVLPVGNASGHGCVSWIGCGFRNHCRILLWLPPTLLLVLFVFWGFEGGPWISHTAAQPGLPSHTPCTQRVKCWCCSGPWQGSYPWDLCVRWQSSSVASCWDAVSPLELEQPPQVTDGSAWTSRAAVPGHIPALVIVPVLIVCMRALWVQSPSKAHQTEMLCSRTWMQQFCSHLPHLSPVPCLPCDSLLGGSSCCADSEFVLTLWGWGGSWEHNWELSNASGSPVQTQSTQQENICLQGVLCRACNAWIIFVCSYGVKWMDPNPAQSRVSAASSSAWIHCPWLQLLPILSSKDGRGAAAPSSGTCVGLCALAVPCVWRIWPWCVCLSLVSWEQQEGSSDPSADVCLLFRKNNWCLGKFLFLHI